MFQTGTKRRIRWLACVQRLEGESGTALDHLEGQGLRCGERYRNSGYMERRMSQDNGQEA